MRRLKFLGAVLALGIGAAACGGGNNGGGGAPVNQSTGVGGSVTISNAFGATWICNFNPFNTNQGESLSFGTVYEELEFVNALTGKATPWLASSSAWSNANKTLTFTIRPGVKFTNGSTMTNKDVAFTFNYLKANPGIDLNAVWSVLSSVTAVGSNQVVLNFKASAVPYFYYIADQVPVLPEAVWSTIKNPAVYTDAKPVGTGPYTVKSCSTQEVTYTRNPSYWQKGLPKVETVYYPAYTSNNPANDDLQTGADQWGGQYIPGIQKFYLDHSKYYHDWFPPTANVYIFFNLKDPLLTLPVRQAIAYAINRSTVSQQGESGYEPAANQTGIVTPTFSSWVDSSQASPYGYSYDPSKAESILRNAGYVEKGGVFYTPAGKALSFNIVNNGGYSDWVEDVSIIQQELKAIGITLSPENLAGNASGTDTQKGDFDLAFNAEVGGPTPYYELRALLYSGDSAPLGQIATSNFERYDSASTDALLNQYGATTDSTTQHSIIDKLQKVLLSEVPAIPVVESVDWYQYDTQHLSGWPTQQDPYAQPAPWALPDWGVVLDHLTWNK